MLDHEGSVSLRCGRIELPKIYNADLPFGMGQANTVKEETDVTIIANGLMVGIALYAAAALSKSVTKARVLDPHTVKPMNEEAIVKAAKKTGRLVVAEEDLKAGGLGAAVTKTVVRTNPVPIEFVNLGDCYAESGDPQGLLQKYGSTAAAIVATVEKVKRRCWK